MAIYTSVPPPTQFLAAVDNDSGHEGGIDIDAWTSGALSAAPASAAVAVAPVPSQNGIHVSLQIPLDEPIGSATRRIPGEGRSAGSLRLRGIPGRGGDGAGDGEAKPRKEVLRRDSLKRREALLRGKEGSRRRQRWENDHLLHVPNAQPPLPTDWAVQPTHPVQHVPYYLAPLWDAGVKQSAEATAKKRYASRVKGGDVGGAAVSMHSEVANDLKKRVKGCKGAKGLLRDLEEGIRVWLRGLELDGKQRSLELEAEEQATAPATPDSDEDEIVFIGRDGSMKEAAWDAHPRPQEKLVWESALEDRAASFGRWMVHSIAEYYNLNSRSVTVGCPARREAYVGIKTGQGKDKLEVVQLPRPLWAIV